MTDDPTIDAARNLRTILDLAADLEDQAVARATAHDMPGGEAMAMLGPVSSPEAWQHRRDTLETRWADDETATRASYPPMDDDDWEAPLTTILFWTEQLRFDHDATIDHPTLTSEAEWLRGSLRWIYDHEPNYADLERDLARCVARLEAVLYAGEREATGAVLCECGHRLVRDAWPGHRCDCPPRPTHASHFRAWAGELCCLACATQDWDERHAQHSQGGYEDDWRCEGCDRIYLPGRYKSMVARDARDNATALPMPLLTERFEITAGNVRVLASRGKVRKRGKDELGRVLYDVDDVKRYLGESTLAG